MSRKQNSVVILSLSAIFRVTGTHVIWQQLLRSVVTKQPRGTYCFVVTAVAIFADNKLFLWSLHSLFHQTTFQDIFKFKACLFS